MAIVFAQGTYEERIKQTMRCVERVRPGKLVDRAVIIADETLSNESKKWLEEHGCEVYIHPWEDSMVKMRNQYLSYCNNGDWIVVSDPDELFCEDFMKDLRKIVKEADKRDAILILINSRDVTIKPDGTKQESVSNFFKNLIFKYSPEVRYEGVGKERTVHETLLLPPGAKQATLPRKYYYEHFKTEVEVWERAFRNVWIAGGGNNVGDRNPRWKALRGITDRLGFKSWPEVREYLRHGNIDNEFLRWIQDCREESGWDWQNEMFDCLKYYKTIHPEELPDIPDSSQLKLAPPSPGSPPDVMAFVEQCYLDTLGRHADTRGKTIYTNQILTGKIRSEDLPGILRRSQEYRERFPEREGPPLPEEKVRIPVPVDVDVRIGEDAFRRALMKSETYWRRIKPKLELAEKWDSLLNIARKLESEERGVDESRKETFIPFVETFSKYAPPNSYPNILNIGAGCGAETAVLREKGYDALGITFGKDNIKYAKEKFGIDLLEMDMHNLQFPDRFFDGAFMIQTFEHAFSPWLLIIELRRVLKDGGMVFLDVPDPDDEAMLKTIWHTSVLYSNQIKALFWKAGFKEVADLSQKHRLAFLFAKIPDGQFEMWGYIQHIYRRRSGGNI